MLLKVGRTDLVLRMIEAGMVMRDLTLENPIRAIREISHDITGRRKVRLASGREASALEIQQEYFDKALEFVERRGSGRRGRAGAGAVGAGADGDRARRSDRVDREIDWVIKYRLIERYRRKNDLAMAHPRVAQLDLAYHDIHRGRGLYYLLERKGRSSGCVDDLRDLRGQVGAAADHPGPAARRVHPARAGARRDFTVDWVHLKLNDQAQRTVLCKDPFRSVDERVEKLIASM